MKEGEIGQEAELIRKVTSEVPMVEINASNSPDGVVVGCGSTEDPGVGADIGSDPVAGEIQGI